MHNLKEIRKNLESYKKKFFQRNVVVDFDKLLNLDKSNRDLIQKKEYPKKEVQYLFILQETIILQLVV